MPRDALKNKIYFPNLDGLRFFAFFAVFLAHSFYSDLDTISRELIYAKFREIGHLGIFGVNFFFVLSGYLITYLLLVEKTNTGKVSLKNFYLRRILRIWPLYYAVIIIGFFIIPLVQREVFGAINYAESANLWEYILFINNFSIQEPRTAVLGVLWSIAVEEQFYLIWPIVVAFIAQKRLPYVFSLLIIASILFRVFLIGYGYKHTLSCMSDLSVGSLFAYYSFRSETFKSFFKNLESWKIFTIYLLGFSLFFLRSFWADIPIAYLNERLLFSLFFSFIILEQNYSCNPIKVGRLKVLTSLGKVTYGLYMLHFLAIYIISKVIRLIMDESLLSVLAIEPIMSLGLSIIVSFASYKYFEKPFLRLKSKYSS